MCDTKLLKSLNDVGLEAGGFKKGRFNPVPGKYGHGAPFEQFSGTYKGNDAMSKLGISPSASAPVTAVEPYQSPLSAASQAKLATLSPYANTTQTGAAAKSAQETEPSLAQFFTSNNVQVSK